MSSFRLLGFAALALRAAGPVQAQSRPDHGTIVITIGAEPTLPVPTLSSAKANVDVASLMFLPLARPGRKLVTADEKSFEPMLARSWNRRDSVTLAFDLDLVLVSVSPGAALTNPRFRRIGALFVNDFGRRNSSCQYKFGPFDYLGHSYL